MYVAAAIPILAATLSLSGGDDICGNPRVVERTQSIIHRKSDAPIGAIRNGVLIVPADDINSPFRHPFDLAGRSIRFGHTDTHTFAVSNDSAGFDSDIGQVRTTSVVLPFDFPFFGSSLKQIEISPFNGIYASAPDTAQFDQYGPLEIAAQPLPTIAPLLTTRSVIGQSGASIHVRTAPDRVIVTWSLTSGAVDYVVQAKLFPSGDIVFSYLRVNGVPSAAIVVSPGLPTLNSGATQIASLVDPAGDAALDAADIVSASISESDEFGIVEIRIELAATPSAAGLRSTDFVRYDAIIGGARVSYFLFGDGSEEFSAPAWGATVKNVAAHVEGHTIVLDVLQQYLGVPAGEPLACTFQTIVSTIADPIDSASTTVTLHAAQRPVLNHFNAGGEVSGLAAEAFTLPIFDPFGAWDEIKQSRGLSETDYDAVAFYQNFTTDIIYYAGAYSTVGNPGVDGIWRRRGVGTAFPVTTSLLHMNRIGFAKNSDAKSAGRVLMHEFGHRWLYGFEIRENGASSRVLSPTSVHPAQYVDTRAAFRVYAADDASVMGGGYFTDQGSSTFRSGNYGAYGYSWLDLYLMGLAPPEEVQSSFYLSGTSLPVGVGYFPPEQQLFRGTRHDVVVQQVVDAMGPRLPAWPDTKRHFKVLFVVVEDPDNPASDNDLAQLDIYRTTFAEKFAVATNNRADVSVSWQEAPALRRRATRP